MKISFVIFFAFILISCRPSFPPDEYGSELIIRKMRHYPITENYSEKDYRNTPIKYWVLKIYYRAYSKEPHLKVLIQRYMKEYALEFDVYQSFETKEEMLKFATDNNIDDIILDESRSIILRPMKGQRDNY